MAAQEFLAQYSGESVDQLISMEKKYRIDSLVLAFEQAVDQKAARKSHARITDEERVILAAEALEREVNNGGYSQFFINSSREHTSIVVESPVRIGCPKIAAITEQAIQALCISGEPTLTAVDAVMSKEDKKRDARLSKCDEMYYKGGEDIAGRLFAFIKSNKGKIKLP